MRSRERESPGSSQEWGKSVPRLKSWFFLSELTIVGGLTSSGASYPGAGCKTTRLGVVFISTPHPRAGVVLIDKKRSGRWGLNGPEGGVFWGGENSIQN